MVFGAWLLELKEHLNTARSGTNPVRSWSSSPNYLPCSKSNRSNTFTTLGTTDRYQLSSVSCKWTIWCGLECAFPPPAAGHGADSSFRGSEVVFELYSKDSAYYIRVLWSGQPIVTSTPLGTLDMIAMDEWISCLCNFRISILVADGVIRYRRYGWDGCGIISGV